MKASTVRGIGFVIIWTTLCAMIDFRDRFEAWWAAFLVYGLLCILLTAGLDLYVRGKVREIIERAHREVQR